mgnify:CR=1 FL=1
MTKYVIDAYAWVEYFEGSKIGEKVKEIIEDSRNSIFTNAITVAELSSHFNRKNLNFTEAKKILFSLSSIIEVSSDLAEEVGKVHAELKKSRKHIGLADIFVLVSARRLNAKVVTGDEDFRGLKEAFMVK